MRIDYKATIWFTIEVDDEATLQKAKELLEQGLLPDDLYNELYDELGSAEILYDTEELLSPKENNNQATVEIFDSKGNKIWGNSIKEY
jgi:hypothetical protein